jgi:hypothetical protein
MIRGAKKKKTQKKINTHPEAIIEETNPGGGNQE